MKSNEAKNPNPKDDDKLAGKEDERDQDIDVNTSIKRMRQGTEESEDDKENDAMNYKNDREHGTFNPKNI